MTLGVVAVRRGSSPAAAWSGRAGRRRTWDHLGDAVIGQQRKEGIGIEAEAYELFRRGTALLADHHAHQAATVLERVEAMEPERGSICEALGRAYYESGRLEAAREQFAKALELDPANDYAHFCLALCLLRAGEVELAIGHLRLALAMRPQVDDYQHALARAERMRPAQP